MKLASFEIVYDVRPHPNADALDIVTVLGYECITPRNRFSIGDAVILIQPDTVLPDKPWAETFRKRSNRVKAIKLRGEWSFGIVLGRFDADLTSADIMYWIMPENIGKDMSEALGVTKYEAPVPQDMSALGYLPTNLPKTDEERYQNLMDTLPWGEQVDVTLKIDGQSATYFYVPSRNGEPVKEGVASRSLVIKPDAVNNYTRMNERYKILERLRSYCEKHNVALALRGEIYGQGIQGFNVNPHAKGPIDFACFSVYNMDTFKYEGPNDPHYYAKVANELFIPVVPLIEQTVLTPELIEHYAKGIVKIDGKPFEGVVLKGDFGSFKVINLAYDSNK